MQKRSTTPAWINVALILIQLFDIIIHIATNQVEPIRITSNVVIIVWVVALWMGWLTAQIRNSVFVAAGIYLLLNLIFLAQNGLTNSEQGDAPRTVLFLLLIVTMVLSGFIITRVPEAE